MSFIFHPVQGSRASSPDFRLRSCAPSDQAAVWTGCEETKGVGVMQVWFRALFEDWAFAPHDICDFFPESRHIPLYFPVQEKGPPVHSAVLEHGWDMAVHPNLLGLNSET